jgi:hypothetical protein
MIWSSSSPCSGYWATLVFLWKYIRPEINRDLGVFWFSLFLIAPLGWSHFPLGLAQARWR